MSLLIVAILIVVAIALLVWAVDYLNIGNPPANIVKFAIIAIGAVAILHLAGLL